jgi:hypothetical protein
VNSGTTAVTAGLGGFLVLFGLALAVWFLGRDLTRRLRRMRLREELRAQLEEAEQGDQGGQATAAPDEGAEQQGESAAADGSAEPPGGRD